ncbi:MAG: DegV family protein [Erysipelotrichaceae bacterium]|nr:DegV family protein [Erysipelotrichaceae bacterium]
MNLITDTGSIMSQERANELDIILLPLQVEVAGKNYRDYFELDSDEFIKMIEEVNPTSSQPAIGEVMNAYESVDEALHITMTKGLSATYDSALGVIESNNIKHIRLFNSKTLAGTEKYLVELAAKLLNVRPLDEIVARMEKCLTQCQSYLIPSDFGFLRRGGRLSPLAATLGGLIKLKPIVTQTEGSERLEKLGFGRTWNQAINQIVSKMIENGVDHRHKIYISHAQNMEAVEIALKTIKGKIANIEIEIMSLSPVMITQGGPGCMAIQYILKDIG